MESLLRQDKLLAENAAFAYAVALVKEADDAKAESAPDVKQSIERLDAWFYNQLKMVELQNRKRTRRIRRRSILRIAAIIIAAILLSSTLLIGTVEAFRIEFMNIIRTIFPTHTEFRMEDDESTNGTSLSPKDYPDLLLPTYIPEGLVIKEIVGGNGNYLVIYQSVNGKSLSIEQSEKSSGTGIDTEGAAVEKIWIKGEPATQVIKDDNMSIYMNHGAYAYRFSSTLSREELVRIVESF